MTPIPTAYPGRYALLYEVITAGDTWTEQGARWAVRTALRLPVTMPIPDAVTAAIQQAQQHLQAGNHTAVHHTIKTLIEQHTKDD